MSASELLAGSVSPLAEVLVRRLQARSRTSLTSGNRQEEPADQATLPFDEGAADLDTNIALPMARPDELAVAILLGQALENKRDVLANLQRPDAVTIFRVPNSSFIKPLGKVLRHCLFSALDKVVDAEDVSNSSSRIARTGAVAVFMGCEVENRKSLLTSDQHFVAAVLQRYAIIGIATDPAEYLTADLVRLASATVELAPINAAVVASVIEAVTAKHPGIVDDALASRATLADLVLAVRADLGASGSLIRLQRILPERERSVATIPISAMHGLGEARQWALDLVHDIAEYKAGRLRWADATRNALLQGPPGSGKTSLARAIAAATPDVAFVATSCSQWFANQEGHLGHVLQAIRNTFVVPSRPAVIFIDEIDSLAARGSSKNNDDWFSALTNCLLEALDGFERTEGLWVLAACNDALKVDKAILRAGRLDRVITISLPDPPALAEIFRQYLGADLAGIDLLPVALATDRASGADVEKIVRDARRKARIADRAMVLSDLMDSVLQGKPMLSADLRRIASIHESGHAIALLALGLGQPRALSISFSGGYVDNSFDQLHAQTRRHIEQVLVIVMAGRAAEEIFFGGEITAGAGGDANSDLARACRLALRIETSFGLGDQGPLWWPDDNLHALLNHGEVRASVRCTVESSIAIAKELLSENRVAVAALADALFERGYLDQNAIQRVLKNVRIKQPSMTLTASVAPATPDESDAAEQPVLSVER